MARQVLPWIGAAVGFVISGFNPYGAQIGFMIGSMVGNAVDPQIFKGPSIGDGQTQTSKEGVPRPRGYGTFCVSGNLIYISKVYKTIKRTRQGKGGPVTEEERLSRTFAIGITGHEVNALSRIWEDEKNTYDVRASGSQVAPAENAKYAKKFRFYRGDDGQMPDPALESELGSGNAPAYRGMSYIVFEKMDVTDRRGSIPNFRFEVTNSDVALSPALFSTSHTFSGKPGSYEALQRYHNGSSYENVGVMTTDQNWIFSTRAPNNFFWYKRDPDTLLYSLFNNVTDFLPFLGILLTSDEKYLICKGASEIRSYLITSSNLTLIDTCVTSNYGGGRTGRDIDIDSTNTLLASRTGTSSGGSGLTFIDFNPETGMFGAVREKKDSANPAILTNTREVYFLPGTKTVLLRSLVQDLIIIRHTDFFIVDTINYGLSNYVPGSVNSGMNIFKNDLGWGVFWPKGFAHPTNPATNVLIQISSMGLFGAVTENYVPLSDIQAITPIGNAVESSDISADRSYIVFANTSSTSVTGQKILYIYERVGNSYQLLQTKTLAQIQTESGTGSGTNSSFNSNFVGFSGGVSSVLVTGSYSLRAIINDLADLCDIPTSKLDTSDLDGIGVRGFVIAQQYPAKNAITALQQGFFFDPSEYDEKLNFILRGKDVTITLTEDDFIDNPFEQNRKSSIEYPRKLNLMYQNATIGYDSAKATRERNSPNVEVSGEKTIEIPMVLIEDEAAQIADKQLKIAWAEAQGEYKFSLPCNLYDRLVPSDVFGLSLRGIVQRMRVESMERADGVLTMTAKVDRQSAYTSNVTGIPLPPPLPPPPTITGDTVFAYLNIPALIDSNDILGYYVAATGQTEAYYGSTIERKTDGVDEEYYVVKNIAVGTTIGRLLSVVNDASEHYTDTTNVVHLQLYNTPDFEVFQPLSEDTFLRENNALALCRSDGTAEIVQFRDVENLGNGQYKLSRLLRGRLNSGTDAHSIGTKVVWLQDAQVVVTDGSEIGETFAHRPVSYDQSPEEATIYLDDFSQPLMQTEFPVDLLAVELNSSLDAVVTWSPRERFGTDINPIRSVNWLNYHIVYTDGTLTEEFDSILPTHTHDVSAYTGTLTVTVTQVNRYTGQGPGVSESVTL